jgi:hypothetical protein
VRRPEGGSASIELVGLMPVVAIACLALGQGAAAAYATQAASDGARQAARAYSLDRDPGVAARASLPGGLELAGEPELYGPGHGVRLTVRIPRLLPIGPATVTRQAQLP